MLRSDFIQRPEGRLHIVRSGDSGPPVLLLGGAGLDNALLSWRHAIPALSSRYRVYAPDWPKQGASRPWSGVADHAALLSCVTTILDHYGLERCALVGLSQGGAIAIGYALDFPGRVEALVAVAPGGIIDFPPGIHQLYYLTTTMPRVLAWTMKQMLGSRERVASFARRGLFPTPPEDFDAVVDELMAELASGWTGATDWQNASIGPWRMNIDHRPRLHQIRCPTLFIQGDRDIAVKPEFTRQAAAAVPGAEFTLLENHGHWPNRQSPDRFNALVLGYLDRTLPQA